MTRVFVYDTTLRDGSQGEGINFSVMDKLRIAEKLDAFGVRPGGYFQYEDGNRTYQVQGAKVDAARREAVREKMKLGRRNARRINFFPRG